MTAHPGSSLMSGEQESGAKALVTAAATINAFYQWVDQIEEAGGATSISGVAKCHAFLASMKKNRARIEQLVMEPARAALARSENGA